MSPRKYLPMYWHRQWCPRQFPARLLRTWSDASAHPGFYTVWRLVQGRSEEHTSELQSRGHLVCRLLLEKKNKTARTVADQQLARYEDTYAIVEPNCARH